MNNLSDPKRLKKVIQASNKDQKALVDSNDLNSKIHNVCGECGISANVLTCLKKYGKPPKKLRFDISTMHTGKCDYCGEEKSITEVRDYFYGDFNLLKNFE